MKKLLLVLVCAVGLLVACNSDETGNPPAQTVENQIEANSLLISKLNAFNDSLMQDSNHHLSRSRRGIHITIADLLGAAEGWETGSGIGKYLGRKGRYIGGAIGAVLFGGVASYKAYQNDNNSEAVNHHPSLEDAINAYLYCARDTGTICISRSSEPEIDFNIGESHNQILSHLLENDYSLEGIQYTLSDEELFVVQDEEFVERYYKILNSPGEIVSLESPMANTILVMYVEIIETYPNNLDDLEFISNKYREMISTSDELTQEEKETLYSALDVAVSSYQFWTARPQ